jgi:hypothetical protein
MSAQIIALPTRPSPPNVGLRDETAHPTYAWIAEASRRFLIAQGRREALAEATPAAPAPDTLKEILTLLRRLDRRLAKIHGAGALAEKKAGAQ